MIPIFEYVLTRVVAKVTGVMVCLLRPSWKAATYLPEYLDSVNMDSSMVALMTGSTHISHKACHFRNGVTPGLER